MFPPSSASPSKSAACLWASPLSPAAPSFVLGAGRGGGPGQCSEVDVQLDRGVQRRRGRRGTAGPSAWTFHPCVQRVYFIKILIFTRLWPSFCWWFLEQQCILWKNLIPLDFFYSPVFLTRFALFF